MRTSLIAIAVAGTLASGVAAAQGYDARQWAPAPVQYDARVRHDVRSSPAIDEREERMRERIQRGVDSGRLTRPEARRLSRELESIEAKERYYMSDGVLARWEERELARDLDRLAGNMRVQLRDEDRRY